MDLPRSMCVPGYTTEPRNSLPVSGVGLQRSQIDKVGEGKVEWNDDKVGEAKVEWSDEGETTGTPGTRRESIIVIQRLSGMHAS